MATPPICICTILPWGWRGGKYSPVPYTRDSAHKSFGPTDLTSTYSVCTLRVFGGIGHRTYAFRSRVRCSNHQATHESPDNVRSVAFSQLAHSPRLIEDEIFNDRDIMNNMIDYEDGREEHSLKVDK
ncbi:hypothetical protein TNCV_1637711 [Trichonephila clavipes]|nr:hypothetical protein TNCV_1637711 [Trichonephila clavipes]